MCTTKKKARLSKTVRLASEPLVKASDVEEDIRSTSPTTFNLTERSNMTTMEAKVAPPPSLDALNVHLPGDTGSPQAIPELLQTPKEKEVTDDRGQAPMLFATATAGLTPSKWFPTESDFRAYERDDPSKAPDGSLIHTLYLQLWVAGDYGMTLKELLASFKSQTLWHSFGSYWEHKVWFYLQNNPYFQEVKKYQLRSDDRQPGLQQEPKPSANVMCMGPMIARATAGELELPLERTLQSDIKDPAQPRTITRPWFSITHPKGLRTRRKWNACRNKETEAVLTQSATGLEKTHIQQTTVHKQKPWWLVRPLSTQPATIMPLPKSSMNQKSSSALDGSEQPGGLPVPICGGSQKQQAQAWETMTHVPCSSSRKDVSKKRNCPLNAPEFRKLSERQFLKDANKRFRYVADEAQIIASHDSKGYTGLLASQMHSMRQPGVLTQQLPQSNRISSSGAMSCVKSREDDNLNEPAHSHSQGNVNPGDSHFPERMELRVVTTASNRQFLIAQTTPASGVAVTTKSDGLPKATPGVIRPRIITPLSPPHGIPRKAQKTRSLQSL